MSFNISTRLSFFIQNEELPLVPSTMSSVRSEFIDVRVYPQWFKQVTVSWSVPDNFGKTLFNVYFSQASDTGFQKLNETPIDGNFFTDTSSDTFSQENESYFIVEAMLMDKGGVTVRSKPVTWENKRRNYIELRAVEINRREYLLLSRFTGVKSWLFRKRNFGERCKTCWDPKLEKVFRDNCPDCLGTSFEGGYFTPSPLYIQIAQNGETLIRGDFGVAAPDIINAWTIAMPEIHADDIIITSGFWQAYRVENITPTLLQGQRVRQILSMRVLNKSDIEYSLIGRGLPDFPGEFFSNDASFLSPTSP